MCLLDSLILMLYCAHQGHVKHTGVTVPTRRILELTAITVVLMQPVLAMARLWTIKTLGTAPEGSVAHNVATVGSVIL